jgi:hypothetical protein
MDGVSVGRCLWSVCLRRGTAQGDGNAKQSAK